MTDDATPSRSAAPGRRSRWLRWTYGVIGAGLLALMVGRMMLNEPTFGRSPLSAAGAYHSLPVAEQIYTPYNVIRIASAVSILALAAAWAIATAFSSGRFVLRHPLFGAVLGALAAMLLISGHLAADRRAGLVTALEQTSLLLACFLAMQLTRAAWRRSLVIVILAGMATTLGLKGLYQATVEIPDQRVEFRANKADQLAAMNIAVDSPEATMYEARVQEITTKGWFSLANVFGSLMVLLTMAAIGIAVDKWLSIRRDPPGSPRGPPGLNREIPSTVVAAILSSLLIVPAAITWWLTGSIGAIGSGIMAGVAAAVLFALRGPAARHRRTVLTVTIVAFVLLTVGVIGVGISRGGLPMRTLQVRWEYWTGSAAMLAERPVWGVGPGNYADAYLHHRLPGAEESVKNPHNVIVQALTEYGLPGGALYILLLGWTLLKLTGPQRDDLADSTDAAPTGRAAWVLLAAIHAAAVIWRISVTTYPDPLMLLYDNYIPLAGVGIGFAAAFWTGRPGDPLAQAGPFAAIAVGCGLAGFALHNLSDFALFKPGAAMAFWVGAGAMVGVVRGRQAILGRVWAIGIALGLTAATVAATVVVAMPMRRAERLTYEAARLYSQNAPVGAARAMAAAVDADTLDAAAAADLAQLTMRNARNSDERAHGKALDDAIGYARIACERNPRKRSYRNLHTQLTAIGIDPDLQRFGWGEPIGDIASKRTAAVEHLKRHRRNPYALNVAAQYAYHSGDFKTAATYLRRALSLPGGDRPLLHDHLGDAWYRAGDSDKAKREWAKFKAGRTDKRWSEQIGPAIEQLARMDPHDPHGRLQLAKWAYQAGLTQLAATQLAAAEASEQALWPHSVMRFNARRQAEVELLKAKINDE